MTSPPNPPEQGREAFEEIERRFSQLLGRLGQTFEEALSALPQGTARSRTRSFVGSVDEFLAARRQAAAAPEAAEIVEDAAGADMPPPDAAAQAPMTGVSLDLSGGKLTVAFGEDPPVEIDLPNLRLGAAWRVSIGGGTLRFDPD